MNKKSGVKGVLLAVVGLLSLLTSGQAGAVPLFARQTGEACESCHVSFPELTPFGRMFKLNGFTLGKRQTIPLAAMAQVGFTWVDRNHDNQNNVVSPKTGEPELSAASVFAGGRVTDNIGLLGQWTYNNLTVDPNGVSTTGHSGVDNTDLRLVGRLLSADPKQTELIYGVTVHNNPTVQDVWNSTPAWGYPFTAAPNAPTPTAATLVDGGLAQQVVGFGGYAYWRKMLYAEVTYYRTSDGFFSFLRSGPVGIQLDGYNPYWRLAYNHEWGPNSIMIGTFGTQLRVYPDPTLRNTPTDQYRDIAFDAQYQYITNPHTFTAQATWIHEHQDFRASFPANLAGAPIGAGPTPVNPVDSLSTFKLKASYYYRRKYGATLFYFSTFGGADPGVYGAGAVSGSGNGSPNSQGLIGELDYSPIQYLRIMLQYTSYLEFNGASRNYDGAGRNASNNNTLFLNFWVAY